MLCFLTVFFVFQDYLSLPQKLGSFLQTGGLVGVQQRARWVGLAGLGFLEQLVHVSDRGAPFPEVADDACAMEQTFHSG